MFSKKSSITFLLTASSALLSYAAPISGLLEGIKDVSPQQIEAARVLRSEVAHGSDTVLFQEKVETLKINPDLQEGHVKPIADLPQNYTDKHLVTFAGIDKKGAVTVGALEIPTGAEKSAYSYKLDFPSFDSSAGKTKKVDVTVLEGTTSQKSRNPSHRRVTARAIQEDGSVRTQTRQFNLTNPKETDAFLGSSLKTANLEGKVETVKGDTSVLRIEMNNKSDGTFASFDFKFQNEREIGKYVSEHSGAKLDSAYLTADQNIVVLMKDSTGQVTAFSYRARPAGTEKRFVGIVPVSSQASSLAVNEIKGREAVTQPNGVKGLSSAAGSAGAL